MIRGIAENAFLSKWAGGLGGSWTAVRGTGGYIKGTNGESQGVIPFLKLHNDQLVAVNQGGKRRGSGCAYLETWHNDIEDFLELRMNTGDERRRTHDLNTANWVPDLFMKRMEAREDWTLFRANEVPDLHDALRTQVRGALRPLRAAGERRQDLRRADSGDRSLEGNAQGALRDRPSLDHLQGSLQRALPAGPCGRHPLLESLHGDHAQHAASDETAVCNLGSADPRHPSHDDGSLDLEMLRETITVAVRALDNVIDINFYPTEAAKRANMRHRPIGLGVMGLQNALFKKGIRFACEEAVEFNDEFMEAIAYYAYGASSDLAAERGTYSTYRGSKWDRGLLPQDTIDLLEKERGIKIDVPRGGRMDWNPVRDKIARQGMRNSNVLAIAPTATISNIMGTTPCIEPNYKNLYAKSNLSGDFVVLNRALVLDLKKEGLWNEEMVSQLKYFDGDLTDIDAIPERLKQKHSTVFSVGYNAIIDAAARRQKWIDQSQSVNLFLAHPDMKALSHMYRRAWHVGLKTTYYLRTLQASNIEKATVSIKKEVSGIAGGKREYSSEARLACSIEAMRNGVECEVCQ